MAINHIPTIPPEAPFADKVMYGLRRALRKLVEESAANGESLVIKRDGEIKEVPAKDLLKTLPKEGTHQ